MQTIVYNPDLVDIEISGYEDLWDAALESSLGITSNFRVMNGMALKIAGESYNTEDVAAIEPRAQSCLSWPPTSASSRTTTCRMT